MAKVFKSFLLIACFGTLAKVTMNYCTYIIITTSPHPDICRVRFRAGQVQWSHPARAMFSTCACSLTGFSVRMSSRSLSLSELVCDLQGDCFKGFQKHIDRRGSTITIRRCICLVVRETCLLGVSLRIGWGNRPAHKHSTPFFTHPHQLVDYYKPE